MHSVVWDALGESSPALPQQRSSVSVRADTEISLRSAVTPLADVNPHRYQGALLAGGLFACCAQLQYEVVGSYRLVADRYSAALRRPAKQIQFATRCATYWVGVTERRNPDARTAALALWREIQNHAARLRGIGGIPDVLDDRIVQAAFREGFSSQWRTRPPMGRAERRRSERAITPSLPPALVDPADWPIDDGLAWQVTVSHDRGLSEPIEPR